MANESYTIRDYGDEMWIVWVGYEKYGPQGRTCRVTRFIAQVNPNQEVQRFVKNKFANDLGAEVDDVSDIMTEFYSNEGDTANT